MLEEDDVLVCEAYAVPGAQDAGFGKAGFLEELKGFRVGFQNLCSQLMKSQCGESVFAELV